MVIRTRNPVKRFKRQEISTYLILGGAPVTEEFAKRISVDGDSFNAASAMEMVRKLMTNHSGRTILLNARYYRQEFVIVMDAFHMLNFV